MAGLDLRGSESGDILPVSDSGAISGRAASLVSGNRVNPISVLPDSGARDLANMVRAAVRCGVEGLSDVASPKRLEAGGNLGRRIEEYQPEYNSSFVRWVLWVPFRSRISSTQEDPDPFPPGLTA